MMPIFNLAVLLILLCLGIAGARADGVWVYAATTTGQPTIEISQESARVAIGDRGYEATFCDGVEVQCFRSEALSFAVPTRMRGQREWKEGNAHYVVVGNRRITHAGRRIKVMAIKARESHKGPVFLYSPTAGLVGIAENNQVGSKTLYSQGECGFPLSLCAPER